MRNATWPFCLTFLLVSLGFLAGTERSSESGFGAQERRSAWRPGAVKLLVHLCFYGCQPEEEEVVGSWFRALWTRHLCTLQFLGTGKKALRECVEVKLFAVWNTAGGTQECLLIAHAQCKIKIAGQVKKVSCSNRCWQEAQELHVPHYFIPVLFCSIKFWIFFTFIELLCTYKRIL